MNFKQTIYISYKGSDANDGDSIESPLKTLAKAAEKSPMDGTGIFIEGGGVYEGALTFCNIDHLFIGSYGIGIPAIKSGGQTAIELRHCKNATIAKLKLCGEGFRICNKSHGILSQDCSQILLKNVEATGYHLSGMTLAGCSDSTITGCFAHDNGAVGIDTRPYDNVFCDTIRIAHCKAYDNAGDYANRNNHSGSGIIIAGTSHCVVEFCETAGNGWAQRQTGVNGPVGIWCCCGCDGIVFRYNISRYNRTQPGGVDGDGLDIDGEVRNSVMEYNYTYGNEGSGYLLCEFWGDSSDVLWENNTTRYCVSFDDDTRVPGYGAINMSSPNGIPFSKMFIHDNFFVANAGKHCVYNKNIPSSAKDLHITGNILITDGSPAIEVPNHPGFLIQGNQMIENFEVRDDILAVMPRLTSPRDLLQQPVFDLLKHGICNEILKNAGAQSLFMYYLKNKKAKGFNRMTLQLDGPDTGGCDQKGEASLYYDSIKPGIATRLTGANAEISTPLPWWEKDKRYIVRATARLQSPEVSACLFIRDENGKEKKAFLTGTVAEYHVSELEFVGNEKWFDPGKYAGVRIMDGHGSVYIHSIELIELDESDDYTVNASRTDTLSDFRSFGDCYQTDTEMELYQGSLIEKTIQCEDRHINVNIRCHSKDSDGTAYIRCGSRCATAPIKEGDQEILLEMDTNGDTGKNAAVDAFTIGISQNCMSDGVISVKKIQIRP